MRSLNERGVRPRRHSQRASFVQRFAEINDDAELEDAVDTDADDLFDLVRWRRRRRDL